MVSTDGVIIFHQPAKFNSQPRKGSRTILGQMVRRHAAKLRAGMRARETARGFSPRPALSRPFTWSGVGRIPILRGYARDLTGTHRDECFFTTEVTLSLKQRSVCPGRP
jgi:hypothetical protein